MEKPVRSIILPPVSLIIRVFPNWFLRIYFMLLKTFYINPIFYAHSWDFIKLEESKVDKIFNHKSFIRKLENVMKNEK